MSLLSRPRAQKFCRVEWLTPRATLDSYRIKGHNKRDACSSQHSARQIRLKVLVVAYWTWEIMRFRQAVISLKFNLQNQPHYRRFHWLLACLSNDRPSTASSTWRSGVWWCVSTNIQGCRKKGDWPVLRYCTRICWAKFLNDTKILIIYICLSGFVHHT
jgi:hypothetical protein